MISKTNSTKLDKKKKKLDTLCFFWLSTHGTTLQQEFRVGIRLVYRCPFVSAQNLYSFTLEHSLEFYVKNYIQRRLRTIHLTDLGSAPFYNDIFVWDGIFKRKNDHLGHFFH